MKNRTILACLLGLLVLVFQDTAKSTFPTLKWKIESITSGVMHGTAANLPTQCKPGQAYIFEGDSNGQAALCRAKDQWSVMTYRNYQRLGVISKELAIPLEFAQITTVYYGLCTACITEYAWDSGVPQEQRKEWAVMVSRGGISHDWTVSAISRGSVDRTERNLVAQSAASTIQEVNQAWLASRGTK